MRKSFSTNQVLLSLVILGAAASAPATTIYVNDNWGAAPARSFATFPYEDRAETRYYLNVQNGKFYSEDFFEINEADGSVTAIAGAAEDGPANGLDYVWTGAEQGKFYYDTTGLSYNEAPTGVDDPTTMAVESFGLTLGTSAFASMKDAIAAIGSNTAVGVDSTGTASGTTANVTRIVVLEGIYFESLVFPANNINNGTANAYYTPLTNAAFYQKMQTGFTIEGDPINKPTFTRGASFIGDVTDDFTLANIVFKGTFGTNGNGSLGNYKPTSGSGSNAKIVNFGAGNNTGTSRPDPGPAAVPQSATVAYRRDLTIKGLVVDGQGIRVPFGGKTTVNAATMPSYTTQPTYNNFSNAGGGLGGLRTDGEYGTYTFEDNTIKGTRGFVTFDTNNENNSWANWTTINFRRNTISDVWGSSALRADQIGTPGPVVGFGDVANVENNTFRNLGEGLLTLYVLDGAGPALRPYDPDIDPAFDFTTTFPAFIHDHFTQGGAFLKIFNIRNAEIVNNSFINVNITRDWFQKPVQVLPGHPDFLPMGAGLLVRDFRNSSTNLNGPWSDLATINIIGNLFEACQQGIATDPPGAGRFIPAGNVTGNSFVRCRSGFFSYNGIISSQSFVFTNNIFTEFTDDPQGVGIGGGSNTNLVGGVVLNPLTDVTAEPTAPVLQVEDNFFQGGPTGPNGFVNNSSTVTDANYSGEQPGESLDAFPVLDTDGDGLSDAAEALLGTNASLADSDTDGIPDGVEVRLGLDPTTPNAVTDADGDGLPSNFEAVLGTSDANPDSDADGIRDDYEVLVGTDPTLTGDTPSFGDADENGLTNNLDAIRILEAFLNISVLNVTNRDRVDVNRDGKTDNVDSVILYQRTLFNIDYLPFP